MNATPWKHEYKVSLPAAPSQVWKALTVPAELQKWFAESAHVEPRDGGAFHFWGRRTYGAPDARSTVGQAITRFEPDRALGFRWAFDGVDSEVSIELEAEPPKDEKPQTRLLLKHSFEGKLGVSYPAELVDDLWRLTLGNLDAHLRGGEGIVLPDYTDPSPEIRMAIVIDAPREKVFKALLDPAELNKWMAKDAQVDPRVGGVYKLGWKYEVDGREVEGGTTKILELVPNERIVLDWLDWRGDTTRPLTRIAYTLESLGPKTRVTFVHDGFSRAADISDYPFGWGHFLGQLKAAMEGGPVTPMLEVDVSPNA